MPEVHRIPSLADAHEDETVYSMLAKFCKIAGYPSTTETLKHFELNPNLQLDSSLPGFIPSIAKIAGLSSETVLNNHCIINYFKTFSKKEIYSAAVSSLLNGKTNDIHAKLSLISNRLGTQTNLNYCPMCVKNSLEKYGAGYWQREHQLPGVSACLTHHVQLLTMNRCRKNPTLPPAELNDNAAKKCSEKAILLAALSSSLLHREIPGHLNNSQIILTYRNRLQELGFITENFCIRQKALRQELSKFWEDLNGNTAITSIFSAGVEHPFPQNMFYRAVNHHPLKHLLMIGFLFDDFEHFLLAYDHAKNPESSRVSSGNADKIKEVSDEKKQVVALLREGYSLRKTAEMTGRSVGYIKKIALAHQIVVKIRPKKIYKNEIRIIWRKLYVGHSTQKIAKQFSISVPAVEQILSAYPYLAQLRTKIRFFNMRKMHREQLESFLVHNPNATRNQVRLNVNANYLWLFKNDHCWLYENLPISLTVLRKSNENDLALG